MPLQERAALALGDVLYTPEMGRRTYVEAALLADELLRAGWPVVVDGRFSHAAERSAAMALRLDAPTSFRGAAQQPERRRARGLRWAEGTAGRAPRPIRVTGSPAGGGHCR